MTTEKYIDGGDSGLVIERTQYVAGIIDNNKRMRNEGYTGRNGYTLVGSIPTSIVDAYCATNKITLREFLQNPDHKKRLLNNPDFSDLRVYQGTI
jgi:hypothetical protein